MTARQAPRSGFFFDFDGTLAPIEDDPESVQPSPGVVEALARLAASVKRVAVVSARPVAFLESRLGGAAGITLHGLYGLETKRPGEDVATEPAAVPWVPLVRELTERARRELPPPVGVEYKRLSVALHYRTAPDRRADVERWAERAAREHGLVAQEGRMVVELKPPVRRGKGDVIRAETADLACAWYFGDDLSDLEAFRALSEREARDGRFVGVRVAVANPETGAEVARAADLTLDSSTEVAALVDAVARAVRGPGGGLTGQAPAR